ncbi:hypothetical protein E2493_19280 [Sphingomonas parva]|uniref:Uncharacterized protein n=1 Tax=Sphingomonas parva TaxID=2555898 RepID=A0A4Y8ZKX0_9SPHN|nr:hypothetical protein [Sphingomonas parva]TFI56628.1 hypothetical protein E2493_19280 [Sphingomonas parva]
MLSRGEDLIVGLIALGLVPWIAWTVRRGLRDGRLPVGRSHLLRAERPGAFSTLLFLFVAAALLMAAIAAELLLNLNLGIRS